MSHIKGEIGRTRTRGPGTDRDVIEAIEELRRAGFMPAEIHRRLARDPLFMGRAPKLGVVKKYAARAATEPITDPWRLCSRKPVQLDEIATVPPVIAAVVERTQGRVRQVTRHEATIVARLVRAADDIGPWDAYRLAQRLISRPEDEPDVLLYLGARPWRGEAERERYERLAGPNAIASPYVEAAAEVMGTATVAATAAVQKATQRRASRQEGSER